jgi:diguanylate cyclase (GGDEF)-like protein/putative nucleotidyltransferase with HDIG domain
MENQSDYDVLLAEIAHLKMQKKSRGAKEIVQDEIIDQLKALLQSRQQQIDELTTINRELAQLSYTDGLTALYNHRFMMERCNFEFKRAKRYNTALSYVLIDIDNFKLFNDTYGHQFGDFVLKKLGALLKETARSSDICGRYGGEEFMILILRPLEEAMEFVLRLHSTIAEHVFSDAENSAKITVSIGLADYRCDMQSWNEMIARADQVLYLAKNSGRNLVRIWAERNNEPAAIIDNCSVNNLKKQFTDIYQQVKSSYVESANALLKAIDAKDHYTLRHSHNVARYAILLAEALGLTKQEIETIKNAALLHDLGKIGIDEQLLVKKESLSSTEYETLKQHPVIAVNIIKNISLLAKEIPLILHHHERYDGLGYPHGLKENEIPLGAKIVAITDAFDAMTTSRQFRPKMTPSEALRQIAAEKGHQFDPQLVDVFLARMATWQKYMKVAPSIFSPVEPYLHLDARL